MDSILYRQKWSQLEDLDVPLLKGYKGLQQLPFVSADDLRETWENHAVEEIILTKTVAFWHCTSGSMGNKKWLPWTYADYQQSKIAIGEKLAINLQPHDIIMAIILSAPFISASVPYRIVESTSAIGLPIEQIVMSPENVKDSFSLLTKRQPTVFMSSPSLALRMAEEIGRSTPEILKKRAKEEKSAKLRLASMITKIKTIKPKRVFKRLRLGYFLTERLAPFRKAIEDLWGIEAFDIYGFTEGFGAGYECQEHNGLHFPSLQVILEIIPEKELEKEQKDPSYIPKAVLLSEAEKGLTGELVATDFKEALPLIRYRVRDLVKVVDADECACGERAPKLEILGRTDSIVNLGVIRFSTIVIDQLLNQEFENGAVSLWEMYVSREGFKPKLTLSIEPKDVANEDAFKKELFNALYGFEVFQLGYDNELFVFEIARKE
jgi:phenylacetate-CoA ligase